MLHTFDGTFFFFLCSGKSNLTDIQKKNLNSTLYCNHDDTFWDIPPKLRDELVECKKTEPCKSRKEVLAYRVTTATGKNTPIKYSIICTIPYMHLL